VRSGPSTVAVTIVALSLLISAIAISWFYLAYRPAVERKTTGAWIARLRALADDRGLIIERMLADCAADARLFSLFPTPQALVRAHAEGAPTALVEELRESLVPIGRDSVRAKAYASIWIVATEGRVIFSADADGGRPAPTPALSETFAAMTRGGSSVMWFRDGGRSYLAFGAPIALDASDAARARATTVIVAPAAHRLHAPLVDEPTPTLSGETLLAVREGEQVRLITPLRHLLAEVGSHTFPKGAADRAAVRAFEQDATAGPSLDYRGVEVLAATRRIAGPPWAMVAKVDLAEAMSDAHRHERDVGTTGVALLLLLGAIAAGILRAAQARHAAALSQSEARFAALRDHAQEAIFFYSLADKRIVDCNAATERFYGRTREELIGLDDREIRAADERAKQEASLEEVARRGSHVFEARHVRRDGSVFPVEVSARVIEDGGERLVLAIVRDNTERNAAAERIDRLNRMLRTLSGVNELLVRETEESRLYEEVCRIAVERAAFLLAWVGVADRASGRVDVAARAGAAQGYLEGIDIRCDDSPRGGGPTGTAIREGRTVAIGDFATDPRLALWRDAGAAHGVRSSAATPIRRGDTVIGALTLYSSKPHTFDAEIVALLEEMAADIGFALKTLDDRRRSDAAEEAVRASEARMRLVLENLPVLIAAIGDDGNVAFWNRGAEEVTGFPASEVVGKPPPWERAYPDPARLEAILAEWERRGDDFRDWELPLRASDGTTRTLIWHSVAERVSVPGWAVWGVAVDVTDLRRAQDEARRIQRAVEQSSESVVITDVKGGILYVNPALCASMGYEAEELLGANPRLWKSGAQGPEVYRQLWDTITKGGTWRGKLVNRTKSRKLLHEEAVIGPIRDAAGAIEGFVAVKRDETRERDLEAQLQQAQKLEAVGHLAGGIAHDFNNALGGVIGYCDLALMDLDECAPARASVDEARRSGERAAEIARQLLVFSRRQELVLKVVDLNHIVEGLLKMLRRLIGEQVALTADLGSELPAVSADVGQVEQVLTNLCLNARDAMPKGGRITISTTVATAGEVPPRPTSGDSSPAPAHASWLRLSISDTGTGMTEEVRAHIFEPFFTTKPRGHGTGLGLSVVHGIVGKHGGAIAVDTALGEGTTFRIYLPAVGVAAPRQVAAARPMPPGGSETILIVDDDELVREIARRMLARLGYRLLLASSAFEAAGLADRFDGPIHLLLTDVVMPGPSGADLATDLRKSRPGLRVIFISGHVPEALPKQGLLTGSTPLLSKPFTAEALAARVRSVLDAPAWAAPTPTATPPPMA